MPIGDRLDKPACSTELTQNICITFIQRRPNVFDVGPTLYKWYTHVLCLLSSLQGVIRVAPADVVQDDHVFYINYSVLQPYA